jgi:hypothetical protein
MTVLRFCLQQSNLCAAKDADSGLLCRSVKDSIEMACHRLSVASLSLNGEGAEVPNIAVYLPRITVTSSLKACLDVTGFLLKPLCLERNVLNGQLKAVTMYLRCSAAEEGCLQ